MKKMFLIGLTLAVALGLAFTYYSYQVAAQAPPVKQPQFATINIVKQPGGHLSVTGVNGKESVVMIFDEQHKKDFLEAYKGTKTTAPVLLDITLSPGVTYSVLVCRVIGGKTICQ